MPDRSPPQPSRAAAKTEQPDEKSEIERLKRKSSRLSGMLSALAVHRLYSFERKQINQAQCPLCGDADLAISTYPFKSNPDFSRLLLLHCRPCGLSWAPSVPFSLDEYYRKQYADEVQPFRRHDGDFYAKDNPFWQSDRAKNYLRRGAGHIELIGSSIDHIDSVLDFGAGIGATLSRIHARRKFACESDQNARRILKELGVKLIDLFETKHRFDVVISSHTLEHLVIDDLPKVLAWFGEILADDGLLLVEVPRGHTNLCSLMDGNQSQRTQEPHTIFFSSNSLYQYLTKAGFEVLKLGVCPWTQQALERSAISIPDMAIMRLASQQPLALARKRAGSKWQAWTTSAMAGQV